MTPRPIIVANDTHHLSELIAREMWEHGPKCDLNHIDVSRLTSFNAVFRHRDFNGDISKWDMRRATDVTEMFQCSQFNGDISEWNTAKIEKADAMFEASQFKGDVSKWDTSSLRIATHMFSSTDFNGDLSRWNTKSLKYALDMFEKNSAFAGDLSSWRFDAAARFNGIVDAGFKGVLPRPMDPSMAFTQYAKLFKKESDFECYLAELPFNAAHADVLCASAIFPTWFPKEDHAWFKEISGMALSIGVGMSDFSMHVLAQYPTRHSRTPYIESWHMGEDALSDEGAVYG